MLTLKNEQGNELQSHGWLTRIFWPLFFCGDNVNLDPDHLPYLMSRFKSVVIKESFGSMPYVSFIKAPYYIYVGCKTAKKQIKGE